MQINTNLSSLNAQRSYARADTALGATLQRLSSGQRVNSASDDAAGLAIGARLTAGVRGLQRAAQNASEGIALLQVADGAMGEIMANYQRIRELAVQAGNDTNSVADRAAIQHEADALVQANLDIASRAQYNHLNLLDGSYRTQLQVGDRAGAVIDVAIPAVYRSDPSGAVQVDVPEQQVNLTGQVTAALQAGDLTLNNRLVGAAVAGAGPGQGAASAWAAAAAINAAAVPGVTASAATTVSGDVGAGGNIPAGGLSINGVALGPIVGANASALAASAAAAIAGAGIAGVSASASGGTLTLTADGRDIEIGTSGGPYAGVLGLAAGTHSGTINVLDTPSGGAHRLLVGGAHPGNVGLAAGAQVSTATGNMVTVLRSSGGGDPPIDLSSASGASDALDFIDSKIDSGNAVRAQLGALQNRLHMAYDGAQGTSTNLAAARARILDTDYASETAQLTRSRILQQAAVSMVAQANALPQQALLLLR